MNYFDPPPHHRIKDYRGTVVGRLTVLGFAEVSSDGKAKFWCQCECGTVKPIRSILFKRQTAKSCGCLQRELLAKRSTFHGHCVNGEVSPTYESWWAMHKRCADKGNKDYGGKGISVCSEWSNFSKFLGDMGERPNGKTIDRIDSNTGYNFENCRWATPKEQQRNRKNTAKVIFNAEVISIAEAAERLGVTYACALQRAQRGKMTRVY